MSRIGRLVQIFVDPMKEPDTEESARQSVTLSQALGTLTLVVCWLTIFGALAFYARDWESGATGWMWFFVGIAAAPCVLFPLMLYLWQRENRRYAEHVAVNRELSAADNKFVYEIEFDYTYINTMIDRYLQQEPAIPGVKSIPVILVLVFAATWLFAPLGTSGLFFAVTVAITVAIGLFFIRFATRKSLFSDLGYASHMRKQSTYTLSTDGLHVAGPRPPSPYPWPDLVEWPEFRKAVLFRDGILLVRRPMFVWLPNSALVDARPEEVAHLVDRKSKLRTSLPRGEP